VRAGAPPLRGYIDVPDMPGDPPPPAGDNRLRYGYVSPVAAAKDPKKKRTREPYQLPAGRHGLPRQFVVSNQRERILAAVADVCSTAGYVAMSVEDIVVTSGVSRRTFYDNYKGKEDVFLAAYDEISSQLLSQVKEAFDSGDGLIERARESLRALLEFIASEPTFADMCIVEVLAAGPAAVGRRNAILAAFSSLIDEAAAADLPKTKRPPALTAETLVGGIYEVIYSRVLAGKYAELPTLLPDLTFALLLPYIGNEAATEILKKERRKLTKATKAASA
jgi:AcrR family transcriptional regulator